MAKTVYKIPKSVLAQRTAPKEKHKKKVGAYARVSTDYEEQASSYQTQVDYYTNYIQNRLDWEFVQVYTDEGISGTSTKHREGFKQMISDAMEGKIDLIITKSISRFARNTVDTLTTIRQLKEKGIEVFFEKENIWSLDGKGEVLLTIMSSLAQEESRSISENTIWGLRKRFESGKASVAYSHFLGYDKDFKINEKEAQMIRQIYQWFILSYTYTQIAHLCEEHHFPSPSGKPKWNSATVKYILTNEKYKGDALLQKTYNKDFLSKKQIKNNGELQQYYVKGHHDPIIDPIIFDQVQGLITTRNNRKIIHAFSEKIICGECGGVYCRKVWHSNDKYRKRVWQCENKFKSPHPVSFLEPWEIEKAFVNALQILFKKKQQIIPVVESLIENSLGIPEMVQKKENQTAELQELEEKLEKLITQNAIEPVSGDLYDQVCNSYDEKQNAVSALEEAILENKIRLGQIKSFLKELKERDLDLEYRDEQFRIMVERIVVNADKTLSFKFWDGTEVIVQA